LWLIKGDRDIDDDIWDLICSSLMFYMNCFSTPECRVDLVNGAYSSGAAVTAKGLITTDNDTLLLVDAAECGDLPLVRRLVEAGVDPHVLDVDRWSPLHVAKTVEVAKYLLEECHVMMNYVDVDSSVLHMNENADVIRYFISCGADVNAKDEDGSTPLHNAISIEVVKCLVENKAHVNAVDNNGSTPLHTMAWKMKYISLDIIRYLVDECKADISIANRQGKTMKQLGILSTQHRDYFRNL
jgi:ankyrin repeat protein